MKVAVVELVTKREVLVRIPDDAETELFEGAIHLVDPSAVKSGPRRLVALDVALRRGMLEVLEDTPSKPPPKAATGGTPTAPPRKRRNAQLPIAPTE